MPKQKNTLPTNKIEITEEDITPQWKKKKPNWELRQKREVDTVYYAAFPIGVRTKPTAHEQICALCHTPFDKGERQIFCIAGLRVIDFGSKSRRVTYKQRVSLGARQEMHKTATGLKIEPRKVYTHPSCFACFINYLALEGKLPELKTMNFCDNCKNRFKCFTEIPETPWQRIHWEGK